MTEEEAWVLAQEVSLGMDELAELCPEVHARIVRVIDRFLYEGLSEADMQAELKAITDLDPGTVH